MIWDQNIMSAPITKYQMTFSLGNLSYVDASYDEQVEILPPPRNRSAFAKLRCDRASYGRITTTARRVSSGKVASFDAADVTQLRSRFGVRFLVVDRDALDRCRRDVNDRDRGVIAGVLDAECAVIVRD